jgi:hypothetical protein
MGLGCLIKANYSSTSWVIQKRPAAQRRSLVSQLLDHVHIAETANQTSFASFTSQCTLLKEETTHLGCVLLCVRIFHC